MSAGRKLAAAVLACALFCLAGSNAAAADWIRVRWVDDGDTIVLADGRRVRYLGIDAPEIANPSYDKKAEPLGYEARGLNRRLVHRKRVRLELDAQPRDAYDRVLAYVFLPGGQMVNSLMLVNGLAHVLPHHPNRRYESELLAAQRTAMKARRGIWQRWHALEGKVIGNRRSKRFHAPSCASASRISIRNRVVFDSAWEAFWQGYAPARGCIKK